MEGSWSVVEGNTVHSPLGSRPRACNLFMSPDLQGYSVLGVWGGQGEEHVEIQMQGWLVLQLWRSRPLHQGMQAATPAQVMSLLLEHQPYGSLISTKGLANSHLTEKASLFAGERRDPQLCPISRGIEFSYGGWVTTFLQWENFKEQESISQEWSKQDRQER